MLQKKNISDRTLGWSFQTLIFSRTLSTKSKASVSSFLIIKSGTLDLSCRAIAIALAAASSSLEKYGTPSRKGASMRNLCCRRKCTADEDQPKVCSQLGFLAVTSTLIREYTLDVQPLIRHRVHVKVERQYSVYTWTKLEMCQRLQFLLV